MHTNPIEENWHELHRDSQTVDWSYPGLKVTRFRLLGDYDFPMWDVSYCHGVLPSGKRVHVELPFSQLPRHNWKRYLVNEAKRDKVYAKGLGILDPLVVSVFI